MLDMSYLPNSWMFNKALDYASSPFVRDAEMEVSTMPTVIDGKVLPTPPMKYNGPEPMVFFFPEK